MNFTECHILLTGATGGIGRAIAQPLAAAGANLILTARDATQLAALASELAPHAGAISYVAADLTTNQGREQLFAHCQAQPIPINVLINNAGMNVFAALVDLPAAALENIMQTNCLAPMLLTQALLPLLLAQPEAHIINIGSTVGSLGFPCFTPYSASKFALRGFSESLRRELADSAVRVTYLAPRATKTAINNSAVCAMNAALKVKFDPPEKVGQAVFACIKKDHKGQWIMGGQERFFCKINHLIPQMIDSHFKKVLGVIKSFATMKE